MLVKKLIKPSICLPQVSISLPALLPPDPTLCFQSEERGTRRFLVRPAGEKAVGGLPHLPDPVLASSRVRPILVVHTAGEKFSEGAAQPTSFYLPPPSQFGFSSNRIEEEN
ncbi:hypothetical protein GUJ93_ZPchr0002g26414 [Zizania palustris]|uniref:Uncharacterized protein n=1 Tax=Zizania palustris TaxID=103762 RepID=A0A8J5S465_ZIZPA|nr:hypothetical protein GUJ93_ZPchr0002g26414 [Zizania palustris]